MLLQCERSAVQARLTPFKAHYDGLSELQVALVETLNALHGRPRGWRDLRR